MTIRIVCVRRGRSRRCAVCARSRRRRGTRADAGSAAAAIDEPTRPSTGSPCLACAGIRARRLTCSDELQRGRPSEKRCDASSDTSHASSTRCCSDRPSPAKNGPSGPLDVHRGIKHDPLGRNRGNSRNGKRAKTVLTDSGEVAIEVPRDRDGSFEPVIVAKRQRRLSSIDEIVLSLYASGLTTGDIAAHFAEIYDARSGNDTISRITDRVVAEMQAWTNDRWSRSMPRWWWTRSTSRSAMARSPTGPSMPRSGSIWRARRTLGYVVRRRRRGVGKVLDGVLTELRNRGVADVFFLVCDGLKGLPDSVNAVWPATIVQTCLIHLIRNSFRFASRKYWDQLSRDLKPIYTAVNAEAAAAALDDLDAKWGTRYPAIIRLWRNAWEEFIPFLDYGACCRMRVLVVSVAVVARAWLMAKEFRPVRCDQVFLMPPDMREWLPSDHLVWFILDTLEALDLTGLEATRRRGGAALPVTTRACCWGC